MEVLAVCRLYRERLWVCRLRPARFANFSRKCALAFSLLPAPSSPSLHPSSSLQPRNLSLLRHYILRINEMLYSLSTSPSLHPSTVSQPLLSSSLHLESHNLSPFFIITSNESTNALQSLNLLSLHPSTVSQSLSLLHYYILRINECSPVSQPLVLTSLNSLATSLYLHPSTVSQPLPS